MGRHAGIGAGKAVGTHPPLPATNPFGLAKATPMQPPPAQGGQAAPPPALGAGTPPMPSAAPPVAPPPPAEGQAAMGAAMGAAGMQPPVAGDIGNMAPGLGAAAAGIAGAGGLKDHSVGPELGAGGHSDVVQKILEKIRMGKGGMSVNSDRDPSGIMNDTRRY
jgi:hypothetical protein